ncbi:hypothetical protein ACN3XK_06915 [Actinomadura welshii]
MPKAPAVIGDLVESVRGRTVHLLDAREPAPGFLELELQGAAPPGGWVPGHEIQVRVARSMARRYTVRTVSGPASENIGILAATASRGPGTAWARRLRTACDDDARRTTVLAGRHRALREHGNRRLYLGDACALGTLDAYARDGDAPIVAVEVPADAVAPLAERWPRYHFVPEAGAPGDALQAWLERAVEDGALREIDGALLLGHAQSIQRQRRALVNGRCLPRRAITTRPYWATGRQGL